MSRPLILENARIVTARDEFTGYVAARDGVIIEIGEGRAPERGEDLQGDLLIPGLVELHTDHLKTHFMPRPKVEWPAAPAVLSHDAQMAGAGVTTVFDALRVGDDYGMDSLAAQMRALAEAINKAQGAGLTRAEHFIHLRCEISSPDVVADMASLIDEPQLRLASIMDHTPGQRQFTDVTLWKRYYAGKRGASEAEMDGVLAARRDISGKYAGVNREGVLALARKRGIAVASHDDTTLDHVAEAVADGIAISEFPTTIEAAQAARAAGMSILMGGPNVVRGGSHSGNVSARSLAREGLLDILSSDYVPASLLLGALALADEPAVGGLPGAIRLVTKNPADAAGLTDRGEIAPGKRADFARVARIDGLVGVRGLWRQGRRVA